MDKPNAVNKLYKNKEWLYQQYIIEKNSCDKIGNLLNCHSHTVWTWLKKHSIKTRDLSESHIGQHPTDQTRKKYSEVALKRLPNKPYRDKTWMLNAYVTQQKTTREIAEMLICSHSTVRKWLIKHGIQLKERNNKEARKKLSKKLKDNLSSLSRKQRRERVGPALLSLRSKRTCLEIAVYEVLTNMGIPFEQEKPIGPFYADFYIEDKRLIIECDGYYWHSFPWQKERDKNRDCWLIKNGYKVARITEHEINTDVKNACIRALALS